MRLNSPKSIENASRYRQSVGKSWAELSPPDLVRRVAPKDDGAVADVAHEATASPSD